MFNWIIGLFALAHTSTCWKRTWGFMIPFLTNGVGGELLHCLHHLFNQPGMFSLKFPPQQKLEVKEYYLSFRDCFGAKDLKLSGERGTGSSGENRGEGSWFLKRAPVFQAQFPRWCYISLLIIGRGPSLLLTQLSWLPVNHGRHNEMLLRNMQQIYSIEIHLSITIFQFLSLHHTSSNMFSLQTYK